MQSKFRKTSAETSANITRNISTNIQEKAGKHEEARATNDFVNDLGYLRDRILVNGLKRRIHQNLWCY